MEFTAWLKADMTEAVWFYRIDVENKKQGHGVDTDRLNRRLALGANIAVFVGILLLIVELNQNRDMMRAQTRNDIAAEAIDLLTEIAYNDQYASVQRRGDAGEELTPDEQFQYRLRTIAWFRFFENVHYQYQQGLFDRSEFVTAKEAWKTVLASKATSEIWCEYRHSISSGARFEVDSLLTSYSCETVAK